MGPTVDLDAARYFFLGTARLIERLRYEVLFEDGDPERVVQALRAYRNPDGGFGHGLEADFRGPESQPTHVYAAFVILDEIGRFDEDLFRPALDFLTTVSAADGGAPAVLRSPRPVPHAPWMPQPEGEPTGSLIQTGTIVGLALKHGVSHPWVERATAFCWEAIERIEATHPYEVEFSLPFLQYAPDRARATKAAERLGRLVREQGLVAFGEPGEQPAPGYGPEEFHTPIDYARRPESPARGWFSDAEIERALDRLVAFRLDDGGWPVTWRHWNPTSVLEYRGWITIEALLTLRAYGRM